MQGRKEDVIIYIVATIFFSCIIAGSALLCLYMFQPESASWYPVVGFVLVGIPWIFWILAYIYKCCAYCCCRRQKMNGLNVNRVQSSSATTHSSASTTERAAKSYHSTENEENHSTLKTPKDDQRHVHFGDVVVLGDSSSSSNDETWSENTEGGNKDFPESIITSDDHKDHNSAGPSEGEAPLTVSVST